MKNRNSISSRRDFLRRCSLATAGLAAGISLHPRLTTMGRFGERRLGVALLGLGRYATGQLGPALLETKRCYLAGVVTGHPEKAQKWAQTYKLNKKNLYNYENLDRIADNPEIDIIYVVTPPGLHPEFVIRAAKAGKHVISEKPMATTVADCDRMIAACKAAKVKLGIGYRLHYDPFHKEMVRLSSQSELGPITGMTGRFAFVLGEREFRIDKKLGGGGPLMDLGIYLIHAACMATGSTPVSVKAHEEPKQKPELFNEVEESLSWTMEFSTGAKLDASTSFNGSGNQFRVEGKKGWIEFKQAFSYRGLVCDTSRGPMTYPTINQQAAQMDDFADCILTGRDTIVPGELGRRDMQIITAIYESARTGRSVSVRTSGGLAITTPEYRQTPSVDRYRAAVPTS
ncbi:MAG: Gfo/Idh/MocA family oxidoreductase [Pyrinomonadaceae bacterium]|nr:Gfo/Idh/MocA family oxidoreductase [Pyrinomonadaceae bacterium]